MAQLDKIAQRALARPVEFALFLFMVDPNDAKRHDVDAARLHFQKLVSPFLARVTAEMELAPDGSPGPAVSVAAPTIGVDRFSIRATCRAQAQVTFHDGRR